MTQRMALVLAGALTAFILVFLGGVIFTVRVSADSQAQTIARPLTSTSSAALSVPTAQFTAEQATRIAQSLAPGARLVLAPELIDLQGTVAYEVTLDQGIVYVDANDGRVLQTTLTTLAGPSPRGERDSEPEREEEEDDD